MTTDPEESASIPSAADEANSRHADQPQEHHAIIDEMAQPRSLQGQMGDGSGQRGGYGDSDQTNGMEGAADKPNAEAAS